MKTVNNHDMLPIPDEQESKLYSLYKGKHSIMFVFVNFFGAKDKSNYIFLTYTSLNININNLKQQILRRK